MSFSGKYRLESSENYETFMKAIGISDENIQLTKDLKSVTEMEENGNDFKVTVTTGSHVIVNTFTIGQDAELLSATGEKIKTVVQKEGTKLKMRLKRVDILTELVDANTLVTTMTLGDIIYKTTYKRI
ncbi:fatty acid-binding protein, liver-type [Oryzias melastigma]|uniref:Fatty acid binding protein 1b, tandem duplicate 1 n=1 Tax=Oryzias melastigma TaxID=30732 RepID=A0A3B3DXY4_ORYME|nr:fatty acid-binding protein, liver-type [Oryzias melastigma]